MHSTRAKTAALAVALLAAFAGCERREKILDIETPAGGVEIEKKGDKLEIEIEEQRKP